MPEINQENSDDTPKTALDIFIFNSIKKGIYSCDEIENLTFEEKKEIEKEILRKTDIENQMKKFSNF